MAGGFQLGTLKFLFFAITFITIFGVMSVAITSANPAAELENIQAPDLTQATGGSGRVNIMNWTGTDPAFWPTEILTYATVSSGDATIVFEMFGAHKAGYADNEIGFYTTIQGVGISGLGYSFAWPNLIPFNGDVFVANHAVALDIAPYRLTIPYDWMQEQVSGWGQDDVYIELGYLDRTAENSSVYATTSLSGTTVYVPNNIFEGTIRTIGSWIKGAADAVFGAIFGDSGRTFVTTLANVITIDFPGVPNAVRLMVAIPISLMIIYISLIVIRSFVPTLGSSEG
jgi:hypothetical protein